jgi:hypothetical protein
MEISKVGLGNFIVITSPEDMKNPKTRGLVRGLAASLSRRLGHQNRSKLVSTQADTAFQSFLSWRWQRSGSITASKIVSKLP